MNETDSIIQTITVYLIPVLFAISLHEAAHGYVARYFGDPTAAELGRLTANPLKHIDPFGTILLPLLLSLTPLPPIGYAKPVPVDFGRLRNPKKQMAFVAAAGPAANFAMGLGWMMVWVVLVQGMGFDLHDFFVQMARAGVLVNCSMCVFNLIPLPPLDGGRIVTGLLPMSLARPYARIERYGVAVFIALILMIYFGLLDSYMIQGRTLMQHIYGYLLKPLVFLLS
ncbi:site-2 protease family protein [Duganella sp. CY15W]|uniref:site-2 protease family protein n=1 Tax=Duganella sp. CY15W TaxID=2692172 RepID=UPI001370EFA5|nr:site-2 protease family protein [Duganella sp. CY15W]MYM26832.1 site-2 protease family protein [Duganella sp. CY15W]